MALTKKDLVKIKDVVLEVMEPMMVASQNEFSKIDDKFSKIDDKFSKIDDKFSKIDKRFDKIDEEIKEKFDKVLTGQDKILKIMEDSKDEKIAGADLYEKQEEKLENHEVRIVVVEKKVGVEIVK